MAAYYLPVLAAVVALKRARVHPGNAQDVEYRSRRERRRRDAAILGIAAVFAIVPLIVFGLPLLPQQWSVVGWRALDRAGLDGANGLLLAAQVIVQPLLLIILVAYLARGRGIPATELPHSEPEA